MPRCEGRPSEACPEKVNNHTVKQSQGDLMLCKDCENFRFPYTVIKSSTTADISVSTPLSASSEPVAASHQLIVNKLLFFALNKSDTHSKTAIQSVISNFYRDDEIVAAKQLLIQNVDTSLQASIQPYTRKRIGDNKTERSVEDILNVINVIDEHDSRVSLPVFCASSMMRILTMPDDMSDLAVIRSELSDLRRDLSDLRQELNSVTRIPITPDDASNLAVIRSELSDLRREFNNLLNTNELSDLRREFNSVTMLPTTTHVMQLHTDTHVDVQDTLPPPAVAPAILPVAAFEIRTDAEQDEISDQTMANIQPDDFATVVKQNCDKYEEVRRKNRHKKKGVIGELVQGNNTIKGVAKNLLCVLNV